MGVWKRCVHAHYQPVSLKANMEKGLLQHPYSSLGLKKKPENDGQEGH